MLSRRSFAASLAAFLVLPSLVEARERGELLRKLGQRRKEGPRAEQAGKRRSKDAVTVSYGPAKLDIYAPDGARDLPVVMFVHGGGWDKGNRKYVQNKPEYLNGKGYVFVSIDYRLLPQTQVADQAKDVEAAFAYVRRNIGRHGGDPGRIAVMGHSAGCHLTALTGLRGGLPGVAALVLSDVESYDLVAFMQAGKRKNIYGDVFTDPAQWQSLSPTTYAGTRPHPPIFIAYSKTRGHKEAAETFAARLKASGARVALFDGRAYNHFTMGRNFGSEEGGMTGAAMAFLAGALG